MLFRGKAVVASVSRYKEREVAVIPLLGLSIAPRDVVFRLFLVR